MDTTIPVEGDSPGEMHYLAVEFQAFIGRDGEVKLATSDPRFIGPDGKTGILITCNGNTKSANYNPGVYNRVVGALNDAGLATAPKVPEGERRLDRRGFVLKDKPVPALDVRINGVQFVPKP